MAARRVLIIDEDIEIRRSLRAALIPAGWQVEDAESGLAGLDAIRRANSDGQGFSRIITEAFLPDLDGKLFLSGLRAQYPKLPLLVLTGFGDDERRAMAEGLAPSAYLEKPPAVDAVLAELFKFPFDGTTEDAVPAPLDPQPRTYGAYACLRLENKENAAAIYDHFRELAGVQTTSAVRGEYDLILRLELDSSDALQSLIESIKHTAGIKLAVVEKIERPRLDPYVEEFLQHYESVAVEDRADYVAAEETNAYLLIDIDRYQLERIYASIVMTHGVISCRVSGGGTKLTVLMSGAVRPGITRHLLHKLATMDGIRRVREATVINIRG